MTKYRFAALAGMAIAFALSAAPANSEDVIKVGIIQPQAGDCAQWGVPITRGAELWAEELNEQGGLLVGDGKRYKVTVQGYDNICYIPGEELKAARRAVLDDGVDFLLQTFTPASRQAIADLVTQNEVLTTSYGAGYLSPKYPYLMGGMTGSPASNMFIASHIAETKPDLKRYAIITVNNSFGQAARAYYQAGVAPYSDRVEVVYDQAYDADAANDMLGLLTPLMATNPDVILEMGFTPGQKAALIEAADQLGFKGVFSSEAWVMSFITDKVPAEQVAGRLYMAYSVEASEPTYSKRAHDFYQRYITKFGEKEWSGFATISYAALASWEPGFAAAKEPTGKAVKDALFEMKTLDHPIFGSSAWGGKEVYGADAHLLTPIPVYGIDKEGKFIVDGVTNASEWWNKHKDAALPKIAAGGQVYADQ